MLLNVSSFAHRIYFHPFAFGTDNSSELSVQFGWYIYSYLELIYILVAVGASTLKCQMENVISSEPNWESSRFNLSAVNAAWQQKIHWHRMVEFMLFQRNSLEHKIHITQLSFGTTQHLSFTCQITSWACGLFNDICNWKCSHSQRCRQHGLRNDICVTQSLKCIIVMCNAACCHFWQIVKAIYIYIYIYMYKINDHGRRGPFLRQQKIVSSRMQTQWTACTRRSVNFALISNINEICYVAVGLIMMTSSIGHIFRINAPLYRGIPRSPVNSPHKGQWRGALLFSLIWVWTHSWVNNRDAGDLRRYRAHSDVRVIIQRLEHIELYHSRYLQQK